MGTVSPTPPRATARRNACSHAGNQAPDHDITVDTPIVLDLDLDLDLDATLVTGPYGTQCH
ncbi:MAG: hypothetical protein WAW17_19845 [Rhodococcus sp. (in: high G+C Gram-positive bacteria)]|uniref:hypothetical protein n=1 Tax=Rhodococcus sp. TaxID=1831 RepID=UPI003BB17BA0